MFERVLSFSEKRWKICWHAREKHKHLLCRDKSHANLSMHWFLNICWRGRFGHFKDYRSPSKSMTSFSTLGIKIQKKITSKSNKKEATTCKSSWNIMKQCTYFIYPEVMYSEKLRGSQIQCYLKGPKRTRRFDLSTFKNKTVTFSWNVSNELFTNKTSYPRRVGTSSTPLQHFKTYNKPVLNFVSRQIS
jgi:hypothetical protein